MNQKRIGLARLTAAMLIFGTIGIFRKYINLPSSMLAMVRGVIGALFLFLIFAIKKQRLDIAKIKKHAPTLLLSGAFIGLNWILLFEAYRFTTVAIATVCYYMAPVLVILFSSILFREKMTVKKVVCVLAALLGACLVSNVFERGAQTADHTAGILLALGAAVLYASVVLLNKHITGIPPLDKTTVQLSAAGLVMLPYLLLTEDLTALDYSPTSLVLMLVVAILHTGIAYLLYFSSIERLPAQTVAIFSYIDPVVAIVFSAILFRERMSPMGILGAILILGATLCAELSIEKRKNKKQGSKAAKSVDN